MTVERIWQVRLPNGSVWIPPDSQPDNPRASWIYARSTADMFAKNLGGKVVEVTRQRQAKLLDAEIATTLTKPRPKPRTLSRSARRMLATAVLVYVELPSAARAALEIARETADKVTYETALQKLSAALPGTLWAGYDRESDRGFAQEVEPIWNTEDPDGEDPAMWRQIGRDEIARMLTEDT